MKIDLETLKDHPWVTVAEPQSEDEITRLEGLFNRKFPPLLREWISRYGLVAVDESPIDFLFILLGVSETHVSDYNSIIRIILPGRITY